MEAPTTAHADPWPRVYIGASPLGRGLFAREGFQVGEAIVEFRGPVISKREAAEKGEWEGNPLQIDIDRYIDPDEPAVRTNHSCDPNAGVRGDTLLVAIQPIAKDEEITWDYSTTIGADDGWVMICRCGRACCRGVVGAFRDLPPTVQRRYVELGIVQQFILREETAEPSAG